MQPERARTARYVGSAEHKRKRWWGGLPAGGLTRPNRQQTTICSLTTANDRELATRWVQAALLSGHVRFYEGDQDFPKHIWYRDNAGQFWFGFCVNSAQGHYKGWPIEEDERLAIFG